MNILKNIKQDKLMHFSVAALLAVELNRFVPIWACIVIVSVFIIGKEIYDLLIKRTIFDSWDVLAGCMGLVVGLL